MKGQNCKGKSTTTYTGPELCATLTVVENGRTKKVVVSGRLNNPRKNEQAVLTEICAKIKRENPTAKLVSFKRKEGKA